jgi:hypothetical protein
LKRNTSRVLVGKHLGRKRRRKVGDIKPNVALLFTVPCKVTYGTSPEKFITNQIGNSHGGMYEDGCAFYWVVAPCRLV